MSELDLAQDRFFLNPRYRLQWEEAQQCHVLLYPEGLVRLSESATAILSRCRTSTSQAELIAALQAAYPDADGLPDDVAEFLEDARQQEWIVKVEEGDAA